MTRSIQFLADTGINLIQDAIGIRQNVTAVLKWKLPTPVLVTWSNVVVYPDDTTAELSQMKCCWQRRQSPAGATSHRPVDNMRTITPVKERWPSATIEVDAGRWSNRLVPRTVASGCNRIRQSITCREINSQTAHVAMIAPMNVNMVFIFIVLLLLCL